MSFDLHVAIHPLLAGRRSPRAFDEARTVARSEIELLLEAARSAPSCFNEQPWRYAVCARNLDEACWRELQAALDPGNQRWATRAPVLIAAFASLASTQEAARRLAQYDTGAATFSLCLQASALGLAAHQMAGFDRERVSALFAAPGCFEPVSVIAVGYPADPQQLDERSRARELSPRVRRPLTELAVFGREGRLS